MGKKCVDIDECSTKNYCGTGSSKCSNRVGSFTCTCKSGYRVDSKTKKCVDIDECSTKNFCGTGSSKCSNTVGSFTCTCKTGYKPHSTTKKCVLTGSTKLVYLGVSAHNLGKLQKCQGDCDSDSHCAAGLKCFQRDKSTYDFCYQKTVPPCNSGSS